MVNLEFLIRNLTIVTRETMSQKEREDLIQQVIDYPCELDPHYIPYIFWLLKELQYTNVLPARIFGRFTTESYLEAMDLFDHSQWIVLLHYCRFNGVHDGFAAIFTRKIRTADIVDPYVSEVIRLVIERNKSEADIIFQFAEDFLQTGSITAARFAAIERYNDIERPLVKERLINMIGTHSGPHAVVTLALLLEHADNGTTICYLAKLGDMAILGNREVAIQCSRLIWSVIARKTKIKTLDFADVIDPSIYLALDIAHRQGYIDASVRLINENEELTAI